jgi:hypothetical protein
VVSNVVIEYNFGDRKHKDIIVSNAVNERKYKGKPLAPEEIEREKIYVNTRVIEVQYPGLGGEIVAEEIEREVKEEIKDNKGNNKKETVYRDLYKPASRKDLIHSLVTMPFPMGHSLPDFIKKYFAKSELVYPSKKQEIARKEITKKEITSEIKKNMEKIIVSEPRYEKRVEISKSPDATLILSPKRFILMPREKRMLRLLVLDGPQKKDKIYRVQVFPEVGVIKSDRTGLKVLLGYGALIIVRPNIKEVKVTVNKKRKKIEFKNEGNTNVLFLEGKQCRKNGKDCKKISGKRLYADAVWTKKLPYKTPVEYTYNTGGKIITRTFGKKSETEIITEK